MQSRAGGVDLGQPVEDIGGGAETSVGISGAGSSRSHGLGARIDPEIRACRRGIKASAWFESAWIEEGVGGENKYFWIVRSIDMYD
jgi:hypothetical protein